MKWEFVMIHHSLTADGLTVSWPAIRRFHTAPPPAGRGWNDIGYHFGVEEVADPDASKPPSYEILVGRTLNMPGAHAYQQDMNTRAIGVCLIGNFDLAPPPDAQLAKAAVLVRWLLQSIGKGPDAVIPHSQVAPKTCPGSKFDMAAFRARI